MKLCQTCGTEFERDIQNKTCPIRNCGGKILDVDSDFLPLVQELWEKGYDTTYCRAGRFGDNCEPYFGIAFADGSDFPITWSQIPLDGKSCLQVYYYSNGYMEAVNHKYDSVPILGYEKTENGNARFPGMEKIQAGWVESFWSTCNYIESRHLFTENISRVRISFRGTFDGINECELMFRYKKFPGNEKGLLAYNDYLDYKKIIINDISKMITDLPYINEP